MRLAAARAILDEAERLQGDAGVLGMPASAFEDLAFNTAARVAAILKGDTWKREEPARPAGASCRASR